MPKSARAVVQAIFNAFKNKIMEPDYYPTTPIETLKSRLTAVAYLNDDSAILAQKAADFIKRSSISKEDEVIRFTAIAASIKNWLDFKIHSVYTNANGTPIVEYELRYATVTGGRRIHLHASYKMMADGHCYFLSENLPLVRVIGDPILHQPGKPFPTNPTMEQRAALQRQIKMAKDILIETSGAGIAANQCATITTPYQFAIVGVFKDNPVHVQGVAIRYPGIDFPAAMIMVNPQIINQSGRQNFKHACLSVPSPNRCEVQSPELICVEYLDPLKNLGSVRAILKGIDAVTVWHEMNHILDGKTYIDTALKSLTPTDFVKFERRIVSELNQRSQTAVVPELTVPPYYYSIIINTNGKAQLDEMKLMEVLPKFTTETLIGFLKRCYSLKLETGTGNKTKFFDASIKFSQFSQSNDPDFPLSKFPDPRSRL